VGFTATEALTNKSYPCLLSPLLAPGRFRHYNRRVKKSVAPAAEPETAPAPAMSPGLRRYLYFTSAFTGAAILVIEILGAKMLAPYVGTSHFVWTAQIAVTLVSLACGYYLGGWLVDRSSRLNRLYWCILAAGAFVGLSIWTCEPVAYWALQYRLAAGALVASLFLFFVPLTLLATTGQFLIRVFTTGVNGVGGNVGRLSALSTLGSVAGTVSIGYLLIPYLPNSVTMYLTAALLMGLGAVYFLVWNGKGAGRVTSLLVAATGLGLGYGGVAYDARPRFPESATLARANSDFGELIVLENKHTRRRHYLNDFLIQNTYDPAEKKSVSLFTYMLHGLARGYTPKIEHVLCIGMGVGIVPMQFAHEGVKVDVAEINEGVVPLATRFFDLQPAKLNLVIADGRQFLNATTNRYDAVILDAFLGDSSPSHLMTREAFQAIQRRLRTDGTLVINSFGSFGEYSNGSDFLTASLHKTLRAVFKSVKIHAMGNGNVFFVASDRADLALLREYPMELAHQSVIQQIQAAFSSLRDTHPDHGRVLTDDYNPAEFHDALNREKMRRSLAVWVRDL
jgi:spermidine synthase